MAVGVRRGSHLCLTEHFHDDPGMHALEGGAGPQTDVKDAEWIPQLLEHGLLSLSFVPPPEIRHLRMLTRYRVQLMGDRTRDVTRLEQMLEDEACPPAPAVLYRLRDHR